MNKRQNESRVRLAAPGILLDFDPRIGLLERFAVKDGEHEAAPLHQAPWVGTDEQMPDDIAPHLAQLGGDFFCAPFAAQEDQSPFHGWPPNSSWSIDEKTNGHLRATLNRRVFGAKLVKEFTVLPDHPFVYQRHIFEGGQGQVPVSNHANVSLPNGGLIRTSPKSLWMTPENPIEADPALGRSGLKYPAQSIDPMIFPAIAGAADLTSYPWFPAHEDFVIGLEKSGHGLGWTAVTRPAECDLFLSLRIAEELPMTMLWHSNGGRDYPPWSGRHFGCLGVEEGASAHVLGRGGDALAGPGAIELAPDKHSGVKHVIGAIRWSDGAIKSIEATEQSLQVTAENGQQRSVPFDGSFLSR